MGRQILLIVLSTLLILAVGCATTEPTPTPTALPTPTATATPTPPPLPEPDPEAITIVFRDDFEDGVLDEWRPGHTWALGKDGWAPDPGWSIEDDNGNLVLNSRVGSVLTWTWDGRRRATVHDFTFRSRVKVLEGDASIFFRFYKDESSYAFYGITLAANGIRLNKERDGNYQDLGRATAGLDKNRWHTLTVTGEGATVTIGLDGNTVMSYEDKDDPILAGGVAFESRGHIHVDDVVLWLNTPASDAMTWSHTAPMPAGQVWAISFAPSDANILYLATRMNNAYRSEDGGRTWTPKAQSTGAHLFAPIAAHPNNPNIIYLSSGILHRSDDGGDTVIAFEVGSGESVGVQNIAVHRGNPDIVYAASDHTRTLYKTENGGQDWKPVSVFDGDFVVGTLLSHPTDPDRLFVAVRAGIYTSADGGVSWSRVLSISPLNQSLVMDPTNPDRLYVTDGENIYRTDDGGAIWRPLGISSLAGFPRRPTHVAIASTDPRVLYVSTPLWVYRSDDGGGRWSITGYDPSKYGPAPVLAVSPDDADLVYAGVEGGVVLSTDGGASWSWSNDGLVDYDAWHLASSPADPERIYAGTFCMRGVFETTNAGLSWAKIPEHFHYVMELATVPSQPEVLYVTHHDGLRQSLDGGKTWRHVADTGTYHLHGLAVDPVNPDVAYVGSVGGTGGYSGPYSTIYKTTDGGATWTESNRGFPMTATSAQAIVIDSTNTETVYVATYREGLSHTKGEGIGIYKSTDGGGSWTAMNEGLTTPNVASLAIDPFDPQTLYAGTDRGLFITRNRGEDWTLMSGAPKVLINAVVPDPTSLGAVYITTQEAGVFRTTDGGETWVSLNKGLPRLPIGDLMLDADNGVLYVAVMGGYSTTIEGGVYRAVVATEQ